MKLRWIPDGEGGLKTATAQEQIGLWTPSAVLELAKQCHKAVEAVVDEFNKPPTKDPR